MDIKRNKAHRIERSSHGLSDAMADHMARAAAQRSVPWSEPMREKIKSARLDRRDALAEVAPRQTGDDRVCDAREDRFGHLRAVRQPRAKTRRQRQKRRPVLVLGRDAQTRNVRRRIDVGVERFHHAMAVDRGGAWFLRNRDVRLRTDHFRRLPRKRSCACGDHSSPAPGGPAAAGL